MNLRKITHDQHNLMSIRAFQDKTYKLCNEFTHRREGMLCVVDRKVRPENQVIDLLKSHQTFEVCWNAEY